jgi:hypothetical protein
MRESSLAVALTVAATALAPVARAATPPGEETTNPLPQYSPWQSKRSTYFVSTITDLGIIYERPRVLLGYGAPHWQYVALDAHWIATNSFTAPYVGWRASLPFLDAMLGARQVFPYDRRVLPVQAGYRGSDLGLRPGARRSSYRAVDFELALFAPVLHGVAYLDFHPVWVDLPRGVRIYEEVLRSVIAPPFAIGTRGGYLYGVGKSQALKLGVVAEYVILPDRPRNVTRGGPIGVVTLSQHWEAMAFFSAVLDGPDSLGIWHGPYACAGFTHRWAQRF